MSSQSRIPQTLTTMEACFTLNPDEAVQAEFWRHQARMGPIAAAAPGFLGVIGGPIHGSKWLYFCGKWSNPALMDQWHLDAKHKPMQDAAHARWFTSVYIRKWRLPAEGEPLAGPLFCEIALARSEPMDDKTLDSLVREQIQPGLERAGPLGFETLSGQFEPRPFQFVGPLQEHPALAPARYLLLTHWADESALRAWLASGVLDQLAALGEVSTAISVPIRHERGERENLREDGLQRDSVHEATS